MRLSNLVRRGEQSGQMLVSVIVLLTLMFFIGSAMALAVSSSLHTIAQTNSTDSVAYAAESAVAQGLARTATPVHSAPTVEYTQGGPIQAQPIGCNQGASDGEPGRGYNLDTGSHDNGDNNNQGSNNPGPAPLVVGGATWSYAYEVVADGDLVGRSDVGSDKQGPTSLALDNYETITIPWINIAGTVTLELYRTASGDPSLPLGCIGVYKQQPGGTGTKVHDTGPASPAPPMCTSPSAPPPSRQVNGYGPGGRQGPLMASTCRVPIPLLASEPNSVQSWTEPGQLVPGNGACTPQPLSPPYSPTRNRPGTIWGAIGWHSTPSSGKANLTVSMSCDLQGKCSSRATKPDVLYYWCLLSPGSTTSSLYIVNQGGNTNVNAFVVRAAPSGTDCLATAIGRAGLVVDEVAQQMPGCAWKSAPQTFWNRVLP